MRRLVLLVTGMSLLLTAGRAGADPYPVPQGFVVDTADVVPSAAEVRLERTLRAYDARSTNQVAIAVIRSLDGETVEDYARGLFNAWGVGQRAKNNGVLVLLAIDDRRSRIQVGYGLEAVLTPARTTRIQDVLMRPLARKGDYTGAVDVAQREVRRYLGDTGAGASVPSYQDAPFDGGQTFQDAPADPEPGLPDSAVGVEVDDSGVPGFFVLAVLAMVGIVLVGLVRGVSGRGTRWFGTGTASGSMFTSNTDSSWSSSSSSGFGGSSGSSGSDFGSGSSGDGGSSGSW